MMKYDIIVADPPWNFKVWSGKGEGRSPKYDRMSLKDIKALDVKSVAAKDSVLFMWATYPMLKGCLDVMESWGFKYKTVAFTWVKLLKHWKKKAIGDGMWHMGNGYYTRANPEIVLLGRRGKTLERMNRGVRNLVVKPIGDEHSEKPEVVQDRIETLFGRDLMMLELFARRKRVGWTCVGTDLGVSVEDFLEIEK